MYFIYFSQNLVSSEVIGFIVLRHKYKFILLIRINFECKKSKNNTLIY